MIKALAIGTGLALLACISAGSLAATGAEVEALQMPAWRIKHGRRLPLAAGSPIGNGDEIATGAGARVLLRMADGSTVKLGENARFAADDIRQDTGAGANGLFKASLHVIQGAFRFTTALIYKQRSKGAVDVRFTTVTIGIRGTDVWGKSENHRDIVCLIEGSISVTPNDGAPLTMHTPMTVYQAPGPGTAPEIAPVDPQQLAKWADETEILPDHGTTRKNGQWQLFVAHALTKDKLETTLSQLRDAGYAASITAIADGYWVALDGFASRAEANAISQRLLGQFGITETSTALR